MTTVHQRSVHIDAPVDKVFDHVKDPHHFYDAFPDGKEQLVELETTPDGVGLRYAWRSRTYSFGLAGARFSGSAEAVLTREECVPNERIVDHSSTGPYWTFTTRPDGQGDALVDDVRVVHESAVRRPGVRQGDVERRPGHDDDARHHEEGHRVVSAPALRQ